MILRCIGNGALDVDFTISPYIVEEHMSTVFSCTTPTVILQQFDTVIEKIHLDVFDGELLRVGSECVLYHSASYKTRYTNENFTLISGPETGVIRVSLKARLGDSGRYVCSVAGIFEYGKATSTLVVQSMYNSRHLFCSHSSLRNSTVICHDYIAA